MPSLPTNFGLLEPAESSYETSRVAVLPVPFERTTTYGKGTSGGPAAIVRASQSLELYDEELASEPCRQGIATLPPFLPEAFDMAEALAEIQAEARRHLERGKFLVTLGGEHSLTQAPVRAAGEIHGAAGKSGTGALKTAGKRSGVGAQSDAGARSSPRGTSRAGVPGAAAGIGVVQFDAHADLREDFEGTPYSHASVMKRIVDAGFPTLAIGIRSLSTPEAEVVRSRALPVVWGHQLDGAAGRLPQLLAALPERIYLTFDVDYFDPALVPATGTPEPGGGLWYPTLKLLRRLFQDKTVVAMDVVELAPIGGQPASDFLAAKLIYKCLGYLQEKERQGGSRTAARE